MTVVAYSIVFAFPLIALIVVAKMVDDESTMLYRHAVAINLGLLIAAVVMLTIIELVLV